MVVKQVVKVKLLVVAAVQLVEVVLQAAARDVDRLIARGVGPRAGGCQAQAPQAPVILQQVVVAPGLAQL